MLKIVKVMSKRRVYNAFQFTAETTELPANFPGRIETIQQGKLKGKRVVVMMVFGSTPFFLEGTWFIQKHTSAWEAKKTRNSFNTNYSLVPEDRETDVDLMYGLPNVGRTNIHELLNDFSEADRSYVDAHVVFVQDQLISWIRRHLSKLDPEPVGWMYELARGRDDLGNWTDWGPPQISTYKPNVPPGSIRNLQPLLTKVRNDRGDT